MNIIFKNELDFSSVLFVFIDELNAQKIKDNAFEDMRLIQMPYYHVIKSFILSDEFDIEKNKVYKSEFTHQNISKLYIVYYNSSKIQDKTRSFEMEKIGAKLSEIFNINNNLKKKECYFECAFDSNGNKVENTLDAAFGLAQKNYKFTKYYTTEKKQEKISLLESIVILNEYPKKNHITKLNEINYLIESIYLVKNLVNEPANVIYPESLTQIVKDHLQNEKSIELKILTKSQLESMGFGCMLAVAQGSEKEARLVVIEYNGNVNKREIDIALVGKGVTFDSGGLSLKPANSMEDMKCDMAGSATVFGVLKLAAKCNLPLNIVGVMGLVENMPSGNALKPGDIVYSLSGQTVEILNTDAEGRLVLADCLYYTQTKYQPKHIIDLATLTGAIMVALGTTKSGLYSNDDELSEMIFQSGEKTGEKCWKMPLGEEYTKLLDSEVADFKNITGTGFGGSITAAAFLEQFIKDSKSWAHLDVAGVDFNSKPTELSHTGASGYGVKLLYDLLLKLC